MSDFELPINATVTKPPRRFSSLARDIAAVLSLKLLALYFIWYFFVDGHKVSKDLANVSQHFL